MPRRKGGNFFTSWVANKLDRPLQNPFPNPSSDPFQPKVVQTIVNKLRDSGGKVSFTPEEMAQMPHITQKLIEAKETTNVEAGTGLSTRDALASLGKIDIPTATLSLKPMDMFDLANKIAVRVLGQPKVPDRHHSAFTPDGFSPGWESPSRGRGRHKKTLRTKFDRCVKSVRKTVRARKGSNAESAAIAICTKTVLHPRGKTLKRYRKGRLTTQRRKLRGGAADRAALQALRDDMFAQGDSSYTPTLPQETLTDALAYVNTVAPPPPPATGFLARFRTPSDKYDDLREFLGALRTKTPLRYEHTPGASEPKGPSIPRTQTEYLGDIDEILQIQS